MPAINYLSAATPTRNGDVLADAYFKAAANVQDITKGFRDREVENYKLKLAAKLDDDRAEEQAWKKEDRAKLLTDRANEDKFNSIVSAGPTTMAGIITDSLDPSSYNKIALTDDEVKKAQAVNWDTSKITSQSILDKLKGQQALSNYADAVPETLLETRSQLLERAANETGSPTKEMLDRIDKAKAAEIAFATAYNKKQEGTTDTINDLDTRISKLKIDMAKEVGDASNSAAKNASSGSSKPESSASTQRWLKLRGEGADGNILTDFKREADVRNIENWFAHLGITDLDEKSNILETMMQEGGTLAGTKFGDITKERIMDIDSKINASSKRFSTDSTYAYPVQTSSNAGINMMASELANLQARRNQLASAGDIKAVSPRDAALARAKTDLNAILSRYGNVKDTVSTPDITMSKKQSDTIISQDKVSTPTNNKTVTQANPKETKDKVLTPSKKVPTSRTILDTINDAKLKALATKEKQVLELSKDTSPRGLALYKAEKANLERLKKSLQSSK